MTPLEHVAAHCMSDKKTNDEEAFWLAAAERMLRVNRPVTALLFRNEAVRCAEKHNDDKETK
jgi:hypothetical protein